MLTFESLDLRECAEIFAGLEGKLLIFSCCQIGSDKVAMRYLLRRSNAAAIITYDRDIDDVYSFLSEALVYSRLLDSDLGLSRAVRKVRSALRQLGVTPIAGVRRADCALVCFTA